MDFDIVEILVIYSTFANQNKIPQFENTFRDNIILRNVRRTENKETIIFQFDVTQYFFIIPKIYGVQINIRCNQRVQ